MQQCWYSLLFLDLLSSVVGVGDQTMSCFSIRKDHCYRHRSVLNAAHPIVTDNYEHTINTSQHQLVIYPSPSRCTSNDAALLIQNQNCSAYDDNSLLIITCDASGRGGGSKHDGVSSILRVRHGASFLSSDNTAKDISTQYIKDGKEDLIDVACHRTMPSRKSSEVAAIALGMKRALTLPQSWRKRILILSDSEFALDFFCESDCISVKDGGSNAVSVPKRRKSRRRKQQVTQSMEVREDSYRRSMLALMKQTPNGILFAKVKSSSRGIGISVINNDNTDADKVDDDDDIDRLSWNGIGFIDHDAADHLSSITRSFANSHDDKTKIKIDITNAVKPLGREDLAWLALSDSVKGSNNSNDGVSFWKSIEVVGSDARYDRLQRNKVKIQTIEDMLGTKFIEKLRSLSRC